MKTNYLLLLIATIGFYSCTRQTIIIQNPSQIEDEPVVSKLQVVHASPGTTGVKLWQNDMTQQAVGYYYKSFSQYLPITDGNTTLEIKRSKTNELLTSIPATIKKGGLYTLFVCDSLARITPVLISDNPLPVRSDKAQIRFVNILSSGEQLDFIVQQNTLFNGVTYKGASGYTYIDPGVINCSVKQTANGQVLISNIIYALDAGKNYTVFVNGFSSLSGTSGADALIMTNL